MDRLLGVHLQRLRAGRARQRARIDRRSHEHVHDQIWILRVRNEDFRCGIAAGSTVPCIADDADDPAWGRAVLVVEYERAAHRILALPGAPSEALVDDDDSRRTHLIASRELAA